MNVLELPEEVVALIGSYLVQNEDILRLGLTCKFLLSRSFNFERDLVLNNRDIPYIRSLLKYTRARKFSLLISRAAERIVPLLERLTTLHSIKSFTFGFSRQKLEADFVSDVISKMTWLEELNCRFRLSSAHSLSGRLVAHSRLTSLIFDDSSETLNQYEGLTQLKHLRVSISDNNQVLAQILKLTSLTSLDLSWSRITRGALTCLTNMTLLEALSIVGIDFAPETAAGEDWKIFASLPNLRNFADSMEDHVPRTENFPFSEYTRFTKLDIHVPTIASEYLQDLTQLRELHIRSSVQSDHVTWNFLPNLTYLNFECTTLMTQVLLPPHLKHLVVRRLPQQLKNPEEFFESLCNASTLEKLEISNDDQKFNHALLLAKFITRLVNLRELVLSFTLTSELCLGIMNIPSLRKLEVYNCFDCVHELKQMTQLVELWICSEATYNKTDRKVLKQSVPFAVYEHHGYDLYEH